MLHVPSTALQTARWTATSEMPKQRHAGESQAMKRPWVMVRSETLSMTRISQAQMTKQQQKDRKQRYSGDRSTACPPKSFLSSLVTHCRIKFRRRQLNGTHGRQVGARFGSGPRVSSPTRRPARGWARGWWSILSVAAQQAVAGMALDCAWRMSFSTSTANAPLLEHVRGRRGADAGGNLPLRA